MLGVLGDSGIDVRLSDVLGDCMVVSTYQYVNRTGDVWKRGRFHLMASTG